MGLLLWIMCICILTSFNFLSLSKILKVKCQEFANKVWSGEAFLGRAPESNSVESRFSNLSVFSGSKALFLRVRARSFGPCLAFSTPYLAASGFSQIHSHCMLHWAGKPPVWSLNELLHIAKSGLPDDSARKDWFNPLSTSWTYYYLPNKMSLTTTTPSFIKITDLSHRYTLPRSAESTLSITESLSHHPILRV